MEIITFIFIDRKRIYKRNTLKRGRLDTSLTRWTSKKYEGNCEGIGILGKITGRRKNNGFSKLEEEKENRGKTW